jgi:predicted metal-dependent HD superfamily phosphohydrolase
MSNNTNGMVNSNILTELAAFAEQTFTESGKTLAYHNMDHTKAVVYAANELCNHYQVSEQDRFIINAAAWFHDLGLAKGESNNHEERSADLAKEWLLQKHVPDETIEKIKGCIMATQMPQNPQNLNEQIIADSDLWHLGTDKFTENQKLLRQEITTLQGREIDTDSWRNNNILLLTSHAYHTDYARNLLQPKKEEHINRLKGKQEKKLQNQSTLPVAEGKTKKIKDKIKDLDPNIPTRGIETMFRVTISNHLELSTMADSKANIMISVNAIIVSVVLSTLLRRLEEVPYLIIPTLLLLMVNILTIVFAILAVRPKILKGKIPDEEINHKKANLLFFGNFNKMSLDTYTIKMKEMMRDKEYLYENMINNIYFMGIVLGKKYQWLRIAYNIFMYGFIVAVIAFGIAVFLG